MKSKEKKYLHPGNVNFETAESEQEDIDHQTGDVEHGPPEEYDDED